MSEEEPNVKMRIVVVIIFVPISLLLYAVANVVYNVYLHPLRQYPGPKAWAASRLPWFYNTTSGQIHTRLTALHKQYGPVVRIAPNELSYTEPAAWRQIYGHRSVEMPKDLDGAGIMPSSNGAYSIVNAPHDHHLRLRRAIAPAFSEKALREQESMLQTYVDLLVSRLKETCKRGPQDLVSWYNFATFDRLCHMGLENIMSIHSASEVVANADTLEDIELSGRITVPTEPSNVQHEMKTNGAAHVNDIDSDGFRSREELDVLVIGTGFSGCYALHKLRKLG
ncbi:hypothetical protein AYO20_11051 [Fonsecaea nubica]|uniref:Uncharacterized protein n=1 Tax=Fonsecaea nubica TaxID=856822 RepID=A0A178C2N9_9EURO|nr:hypothetical protein AYO20_11051 [Fonsecaea nubica]OAL23183.1 hypothetical protein AYO20_11051 [Fonsecaea nubica]